MTKPTWKVPENQKEREEMRGVWEKWVKEQGHSKASGYFDWLLGTEESREERKSRMLNQRIDPFMSSPTWNITTHEAPKGCICPPSSEKTCQAWDCPRKKPETTTATGSTETQ